MNKTARAQSAIWFFVHFLNEVLCYFMLSRIIGDPFFLGVIATVYNGLAFVPQLLFGSLRDLFPRFNSSLTGVLFLLTGFTLYFTVDPEEGILFWMILGILCTGNALIHISGAELTLRSSEGKLSPAAIFVSGGSFGLITGKALADTGISFWWIFILGLTMIPLAILGENFGKKVDYSETGEGSFDLIKAGKPAALVIAAAFIIVTVRSFVSYGIPTSWNTGLLETVFLYVFMGIGKALGGILSDRIGVRITIILSIAGAVPFLVFGDKIMIISLIGIMFFSMTMSVTLGMLVSVMRIAPGAAFGVTTVGLFAGTVIATAVKTGDTVRDIFMIVISSAVCLMLSIPVLKKKEAGNNECKA